MWKAMIYKEWIKTRWLIVGLVFLGFGLLTYIFISTGRIFNNAGIANIWDVIINRHNTLYSELEYYPTVFGILLALAQFIPEIQKKRLKLTLHLPIPQKIAYFTMQCYGLVILIFTFITQLLILYIYSSIYFPKEIIYNVFISLLPWYSAGITAYIFTALICLEPTWIRKVILLLLALGVLYIPYISEYPGAYQYMWWLLILLPIYIFTFPWLSIERFKNGIQ